MKYYIYAEPSTDDPNRPDVYNASESFDQLEKCKRLMKREGNAKLVIWEFIADGKPYLSGHTYKIV